MSEQNPTAQTHPNAPQGGIEADDIDSTALLVWGFVSVLIVVIVILASSALYNEVQSSFDRERLIAPRYVESDEAIITQVGNLNKWDGPKTDGGYYQIPIAEAKKIVVAEMRAAQKKP